MYTDSTGYFVVALFVITAVVGALIGGYSGYHRAAENGDSIVGGVINGALTGGAIGFALGCGVVFLGPMIAGTATASGGAMALQSFLATSIISFAAGAGGYVIEETINGKSINIGNTLGHGLVVTFESAMSFGFGGVTGSIGTTGTLDFGSKSWFAKQTFIQEFTQPFKYTLDKIRFNIFD